MSKYSIFKRARQQKVNEFPMMFAFSKEQLEEGKAKLGVTDNKELLSIGAGGFIRKSDKNEFDNLFIQLDKELSENLNDDEFLYDAFLYEIANHEYCYSCDLTDSLEVLGLTVEQVRADNRMNSILNKAIRVYIEAAEYF